MATHRKPRRIPGMWIAEDDGVLNPRTVKVGPLNKIRPHNTARWDRSVSALETKAPAFTLTIDVTGEFDEQCLKIRELVTQYAIDSIVLEASGPGGFSLPILRRALHGTGCAVREEYVTAAAIQERAAAMKLDADVDRAVALIKEFSALVGTALHSPSPRKKSKGRLPKGPVLRRRSVTSTRKNTAVSQRGRDASKRNTGTKGSGK